MKFTIIPFILAFSCLAACNTIVDDTEDIIDIGTSSSSQESTVLSSQRETRNVSYTGTVQPAGISIYMEGTHRLELADGRFILLESDKVDLNGYVGEEVEAFGSIRATVEADAIIMNVSDVTLISVTDNNSSNQSSSESTSSISSSIGFSESSDSSQVSSAVSIASIASTISSIENISSKVSEASSDNSSVSYGFDHSAEFEARINTMANNDFSPANWTQKYCTGHIGFCVPVHKNWWYQSFGATSSEYWHVEMNSEPLEVLNEGPIAVRLVDGSLTSKGVSDGAVIQSNSIVIGYRDWEDESHFEITADSRLQAAVSYITNQLSVYNEE